jgi:hypothetical protein
VQQRHFPVMLQQPDTGQRRRGPAIDDSLRRLSVLLCDRPAALALTV